MDAVSPMVTFNFFSKKEAAFKFLKELEIIDISNNLSNANSTINNPATTSHQRLSEEDRAHPNISDGMVGLNVVLEDCENLIENLDQALETIGHFSIGKTIE